ncbi:hypothetical protein [Streptomyces sp. NPDC096193]|uniref:hypothetical protein n=1 Tax=Streptomyces sp. NPDC096193 TaxID=3155821 RepID=UPI0033324BC8
MAAGAHPTRARQRRRPSRPTHRRSRHRSRRRSRPRPTRRAASYEDESTYAEYEIVVHDNGTAQVAISYVKVDDVVTILDLLEQALAARRTD